MIICEKEKCVGCGMCVDICPKQAVRMEKDKHGFNHPFIDTDKCISCGLCQKKCPINDDIIKGLEALNIYSAWSKNRKRRKKSSSGGVFPVLAKKILSENGCVAGVKWNKSFQTEHTLIHSKEDLFYICGSKYVQSNAKSIYDKVKTSLDEGNKVLFSGTPCQNHALKSYLGKDYAGLFTIDLICHGVVSEDVFARYLQERSNNGERKIKRVNLRHKKPYWDYCYVTIDFEKGSPYSVLATDDSYYTLFNVGYSLRTSCTQCKYTNLKRYGDITLADFWGFKPHNFKTSNFLKGVSLVMINTQRGLSLFNEIQDKLVISEATEAQALKSNKSLSEPFTVPTEKVAEFWKDYDNGMSIDKLRDCYTGKPFYVPKMLKLKRIMQKYRWLIKKNGTIKK